MKIVCFGDSLTSCGGENGRFSDVLQDRFPEHEFVNRGVGGDAFPEALMRFDVDVLAERPDIVLVALGANDWWRDERPCEAWAKDLETIVRRLRDEGAMPVILGVFGPCCDAEGRRYEKQWGIDARAVRYRQLEAEIAVRYGCPYVANIQERMFDDRCCWLADRHPNEFGNRRVADAIEPILSDLLGTPSRPVRQAGPFSLGALWRDAVALAPSRLAAVDGDRRLTYGEAGARVEQLAAGLARAAGRARPTVAAFLPNGLEYYLLYWAVARLGGIIVPLNTWLKTDSLASILARCEPDLLVVRSIHDRAVLAAARSTPPKAVFGLKGGDGVTPWEGLFQAGEEAPTADPQLGDVAVVMHTSGTTAEPKGAVMRHQDLAFNIAAGVTAHQFCRSDVHLLVNPMFHCAAMYTQLPTAAWQQASVVITADSGPEALLELVQQHRITTFLSVPMVFQRIIGLPPAAHQDCPSLRLLAYAGAPMPLSTARALAARFPDAAVHHFFGLTETISITHVLDVREQAERAESIGQLIPYVDARVVDEADHDVPPGQVGELLFARENVIPGYFRLPGKLDEAVVELDSRSWFRTGDLAAVDDDGFFFIKGRRKDMIIVGGENVYAAEVEAALTSHELVGDAAVKGVPATGVRQALGEMIKAFVVPASPELAEQDLRRHCVQRLPSYKVPHVIVFLDRLPRNPSGKVVKDQLP